MTSRSPVLLLPVTLALCALSLTACGSDSEGSADAGPSASSSSSGAGATCDYVDSGQQPVKAVQKPPAEPSRTGDVSVVIATSYGDMPATLSGATAPCAVNAFLSLAEQGWYDDTTCHRVTSDSRGFHVLQCGDPTGTGTGGPGYRYAQEVSGDEDYAPGTIAMANMSAPGTTGAQLFLVYDTTQLPPDYTVLGRLSAEGLGVAQKAATAAVQGKPDGYDGPPVTPVTITAVTEG